jgi:hypothetical protein
MRRDLKTNKSLRKGFTSLFKIAADLRLEEFLPQKISSSAVTTVSGHCIPRIYLLNAGTRIGCPAVLRYMFDAARNQDKKAGDGECQLGLKNDWSDLLSCRNDREFEFVAWACGYGRDEFI